MNKLTKQKQKDEAYEAYKARKDYEAVQGSAYEAYNAKLREIGNLEEK